MYADAHELLSPTGRDLLDTTDRMGAIWYAIDEYFKPIKHDLVCYEDTAFTNYYQDVNYALREVRWSLYLIALAARNGSDALIPVGKFTRFLQLLENTPALCQESKNRVARIVGMFGLYKEQQVAVLECGKGVQLRGMIEKVLLDAYLLEASSMRRFFSLGSNCASVKRDYAKILSCVAKRPWATELLRVGMQMLHVPWASELIDVLRAILPGVQLCDSAPCIIDRDTEIRNLNRGHVVLMGLGDGRMTQTVSLP
jgi:hypothetical protein